MSPNNNNLKERKNKEKMDFTTEKQVFRATGDHWHRATS